MNIFLLQNVFFNVKFLCIRLWLLLSKKLAGQAGVANAGYVQLAHLVMDSQNIGFIET